MGARLCRRFESDHPDQKIGRVVNTSTETSVNNFFHLAAFLRLRDVLDSFTYSRVHKSPKTIKTLNEILDPFVAYLYHHDIDNHFAARDFTPSKQVQAMKTSTLIT